MGVCSDYPLKGRVCKGPPFEISLCTPITMSFCQNCGKEIQADWKSCPYCSVPVVIEKPSLDSVSNENKLENNSSNSSVMLITVVAILVLLLPIYGLFGNQSMLGIALGDCKPSAPTAYTPTYEEYFDGETELDVEDELYESCKNYRSNYRLATIVIIIFNGLVIGIIKNDSKKQTREK